jgi:hypothetical protein
MRSLNFLFSDIFYFSEKICYSRILFNRGFVRVSQALSEFELFKKGARTLTLDGMPIMSTRIMFLALSEVMIYGELRTE